MENPKPHSKSYNKWLGDAAKPSHRETLHLAIDRALEQKPADLDTLLTELEKSGCIVERRGKHITLCAPGWKKPVRLCSLGEGYTQEDLIAVLAGTREHTPCKVPAAAPAAPKVNLLVDIQAKLQAGKGKGYERWAKVFNLKQMAQTMTYLSEHDLLDYAALAAKTAAAAEKYNNLQTQIKTAEKRMEEIGTLRTYIIQYAKTRDTYVAYRKAGYSKKFLEAHREEITLHKAAKDAFDKLGLKKLPKVKDLNAAYAEVLSQKKKLYPEYRRARDEMRELLTVKANVDRVLNMEAPEAGREKDHSQR